MVKNTLVSMKTLHLEDDQLQHLLNIPGFALNGDSVYRVVLSGSTTPSRIELVPKKPWLIQTGAVYNGASLQEKGYKNRSMLPLSLAVSFSYMGNSYFEFGAISKAYRVMEAFLPLFEVRKVDDIKWDDNPLYVYTWMKGHTYDTYIAYLKQLYRDDLRLEEPVSFNPQDLSKQGRFSRVDMWFDIENQAIFSFDKAFMKHVPNHVENSIKRLNEALKSAKQAEVE